ncbi:unnamed protein product [Mycena citricolor]|uniref:Uncharacterized protein n=1 Tax=Mycena citricolor TaxID=2018698 RepID=A0AAD2HIN5_9AGAR|nr:unnamed protein product [Mycena citricolor]
MFPLTSSSWADPPVFSSGSADDNARNSVLNSLIASGHATPQGIAEVQDFLRLCPPSRLSEIQDLFDGMKHDLDSDIPHIVHRDPPRGVELYYYDIPDTEIRILYHKMLLPHTTTYANIAFQWQFYIRSSTSQDLDHIPVVELEGSFDGEWDEIVLFLAPPSGVLRINKQHVVRMPNNPTLPSIPLRRLYS